DDGDPHDGSDQGTQGKSHHQWERRGTHPCSPDRQEPTMPLTLDDARTLFDRRRHAWLAADVVSYLDCWVDDLVLETPGRVIRGRADYEEMVRGSFGWAAPQSFVVHHLAVDGDVILADWTITVNRRQGDEPVTWRGMSA